VLLSSHLKVSFIKSSGIKARIVDAQCLARISMLKEMYNDILLSLHEKNTTKA